MTLRIRIVWPAGHTTATLEETPTSTALAGVLPISSTARTWGEEVYFDTPVSVPVEDGARQVVEPGTVAFWTDGDALALPYGPTPISRGAESGSRAPATCWARSTAIRGSWPPSGTATRSAWSSPAADRPTDPRGARRRLTGRPIRVELAGG